MNLGLMKALGIFSAVSLVVIAFLFNRLMAEKEETGRLESEIQVVVDANQAQQLARLALLEEIEDINAQRARERIASERASQALIDENQQHENDKSALEQRLARAMENFTDEQIVCAVEPVPDVSIDCLRSDTCDLGPHIPGTP